MSALTTSLLGSFQASLSVLLTLSYGALAAHFKLLSPSSAQDISSLCTTFFLPALLLTNVGSNLSPQNATNYFPVALWSLAYAIISAGLGATVRKIGGKRRIPDWVIPACTFNNTTSLPLLLTQALASTGVLKTIVIGGDDMESAVERAKSYFLVNSMISNALTFAMGPKLLDSPDRSDSDSDSGSGSDSEDNEASPLLPKPVAARVDHAQASARAHFRSLPQGLQTPLRYAGSLISPTLIGAVLAIIVGLVRPLHTILFSDTQDGGYFNAWLTNSLKNVGDLFTALQMFVVGNKLNSAFKASQSSDSSHDDEEEEEENSVVVGYIPFWLVFFVRFIFWGLVSTPLIYALASRTNVLGNDPILWFSLAMMPVGPPAMILSALTDVAKCSVTKKLCVARMLAGMYAVSPVIFLQVVAAVRMSEKVFEGVREGG